MQASTYIKFIILLCFWLPPSGGYAQSTQISQVQFTRISTQNGLSQSTVNSIVKDKTGYMWFGTNDGLNRYDGYKFKIYRNSSSDSSSLSYNHVKTLFVDSKGSLWAGTLGGGLVRYDDQKDAFDRYDIGLIQRIFEDSQHRIWVGTFDGLFIIDQSTYQAKRAEKYDRKYKILEGKNITAIAEDSSNGLWVGTMNGLFYFHGDRSNVNQFFIGRKDAVTSSSEIADIAIDQNGILWAGSKEGLYKYEDSRGEFSAASFYKNGRAKPLKSVINSLTCDSQHTIWIGTDDGLGRYDSKQKHYDVWKSDVHNNQSLSRNSVNTVYADSNMVWVGTALGGISKYNKNAPFYSHYGIIHPNNQQANTNVVTSFSEYSHQEVYVGTDGGGLFGWNSQTNTFKPILPRSMEENGLGKSVLCLLKSRDAEKLWIGTYADGLFEFNLKNNTLKRLYFNSELALSNTIYAIVEDQNSNIWIGTNGSGVHVLQANGRAVLHLNRESPNTLSNNYIRALTEDKSGNIWIGSYGGIDIYNPSKNQFVALPPKASQLKKHLASSIFEDSANRIWIGTHGAGLFIYEATGKDMLHVDEKHGLSNNNVNHIVADKLGFVWVSTSSGLNKFSANQSSLKALIKNDILSSSEFTLGAGLMRENGDMLFGSTNGFNVFNPATFTNTRSVTPIVITDFSVPTRSAKTELMSSFHTALKKGKINLDYTQSVFTIEFAALNYTSNDKNNYAYMLSGVDRDWQYTTDERRVTYNNLRPGEYVFKVKAANHDNTWNNESATLQIIIRPPFWKTYWAYLFYLILISTVVYWIIGELKKRANLKKELLLQKVHAEKTEEMNQLKMAFFTNVSHELRTPLTLIIDPVRRISDRDLSGSQIKSLAAIAYKNASQMITLVNQLLDFRKFQGKSNLEITSVAIEHFVREIILVFSEQVAQRKLVVELLFDLEFTEVDIDRDKFQKILTNLIANAVKFTPDAGIITLSTSTFTSDDNERLLEIRIADSGPGIPINYKNSIFQMFFQIKGIPRFDMHSSGIGLAIVRELVEIHGGIISEEGEAGKGALFVVKIPVTKPSLSVTSDNALTNQTSTAAFTPAETKIALDPTVFDDDITILVVEDNAELRAYISEQLKDYYHVEQAENGQQGYEKATLSIPNVIVSDVMMNGGDGLALCSKIKSNEKTSHIPVILLTAKDADEGKILGYKSGADAYIPKPFNSDLLITRIKNLLQSRRMLSELYRERGANDTSQQEQISKIDEEFLQKATAIIRENLLESSFDVATFSDLLDMNRRQLTRKLKALIEQTPQEFIIHIRLKTAIKLMLEHDMNISQAAFHVGFAEPANFSRSFSKVYGKSPKNYIKDQYGKSTL
ncbi:hybrid sensor histidine kinase/response regulator transcription factor [Sphingobacterium chungjuense]|uniref:hybrid sensor histidine kinase/response regulator transcription factor n=1 Tax=Sphingobacterium chungjuense TaxID=2675553 RepID=UPI0021D3AE61|nr:two-component regulator propeller domain-containing protein [Sphingobacterium chungjuense]